MVVGCYTTPSTISCGVCKEVQTPGYKKKIKMIFEFTSRWQRVSSISHQHLWMYLEQKFQSNIWNKDLNLIHIIYVLRPVKLIWSYFMNTCIGPYCCTLWLWLKQGKLKLPVLFWTLSRPKTKCINRYRILNGRNNNTS